MLTVHLNSTWSISVSSLIPVFDNYREELEEESFRKTPDNSKSFGDQILNDLCLRQLFIFGQNSKIIYVAFLSNYEQAFWWELSPEECQINGKGFFLNIFFFCIDFHRASWLSSSSGLKFHQGSWWRWVVLAKSNQMH